jgi:hypothetical protein
VFDIITADLNEIAFFWFSFGFGILCHFQQYFSYILAEEAGASRENHRIVASHCPQTLSHNVVSSTPRLSGILPYNFSGDSSVRNSQKYLVVIWTT